MALYDRGGVWYVKVTSPDGKLIRHSTGTSDRAKAEEYHDKLKAKLWDVKKLGEKPRRTWDEAALKWLQEKAHKSSLRDDKQRMAWFTTHLRGKYLDEITRDGVDQLLTDKLVDVTNRTRDAYVALIRGIFRRAMREWEWIDRVPAFRTYEPSKKKKRVRFLTSEQAETLLKELPPHQREVVLFALATGLRQGNVLWMEWERVSLDRKFAFIDHGDTKNEEALPVPLNDMALAVLERQKGKHPKFVFTFRGQHLKSANTRAWRKALKRAGIVNFRWHDLRHTWASWLRQNGVPKWVLKELGGWKSDEMVDRYAHLNADHLAPYVQRLPTVSFMGTDLDTPQKEKGPDLAA